jgi:hypothetical protein
MSSDRYSVENRDTLIDSIPIPTTHTVVVKDNETGKEYKGEGLTTKSATQHAFDQIGDGGGDSGGDSGK